MINSTKELPPYCFIAPLTIGLCITVAASLALASTVALAVHTREGERVYRLHQLEGVVDGDDFDASQALLRNG